MGEHDNAGFPFSYCLLSTATAIDQGKRTKSLSAWARRVRDQYGIEAEFIHVDKDMAEIGTLKDVWKKAKISLCWWHLRRAVRTRLAKNKLSTTPYDMKRACAEFNFIDPEFVPPRTRVDRDDYEGGIPDDEMIQPHSAEPESSAASKEMPFGNAMNTFRIKLPPKSQSASASLPQSAHHDGDKENMHGTPCGAEQPIRVKRVVLHVSSAPKSTLSEHLDGAKPADEISDDDENDRNPERRTFCPAAHRDAIINMIEQHYCTH
jgi:hypothetical protein